MGGNKIAFEGADGKERKLVLDSKTRIKVNRQQGTAGDLKEGMKGRVRTVEKKDRVARKR